MKRLLLLITLLPIFSSTYADPPLPVPVGRVVWVKGLLKAVMENKEERSLQKTSLIYLKDTLITDDKSTAEIVFTDKTLMTFKPETKFIIAEYSFQPEAKKSSSGKYVMNLIQGGFRTITGLIAKKNSNDYKINTPVATIGIRGTDYAAFIRNNEFLMAYYEGTPCLTSAAKTLCLTKEVPFAKASPGAEPVPLKTAPAVFLEKLPITPAEISPFTTSEKRSVTPSGRSVTSFCISQ